MNKEDKKTLETFADVAIHNILYRAVRNHPENEEAKAIIEDADFGTRKHVEIEARDPINECLGNLSIFIMRSTGADEIEKGLREIVKCLETGENINEIASRYNIQLDNTIVPLIDDEELVRKIAYLILLTVLSSHDEIMTSARTVLFCATRVMRNRDIRDLKYTGDYPIFTILRHDKGSDKAQLYTDLVPVTMPLPSHASSVSAVFSGDIDREKVLDASIEERNRKISIVGFSEYETEEVSDVHPILGIFLETLLKQEKAQDD